MCHSSSVCSSTNSAVHLPILCWALTTESQTACIPRTYSPVLPEQGHRWRWCQDSCQARDLEPLQVCQGPNCLQHDHRGRESRAHCARKGIAASGYGCMVEHKGSRIGCTKLVIDSAIEGAQAVQSDATGYTAQHLSLHAVQFGMCLAITANTIACTRCTE